MESEVTRRDRSGNPMTAGSLRELMVVAGIEVLDRDGLGLRPDSISYAKVFAFLEDEYGVKVTRGSVHERIWDTHDDFRRDVLAEAIGQYPTFLRLRAELSSEDAFEAFVGTEEDPNRRLIEFSRRFGSKVWQDTVNSAAYGQIQSVKAIGSRFNDPIASEVLKQQMADRAEGRLAKRRHLWLKVLAQLDRQVKRSLGLSAGEGTGLIYLLNRTLLVGGHLNHEAGCHGLGEMVKLRSGPSGEFQSYSLASVAALAVLECLTEPADRLGPGADLPMLKIDPKPHGSSVSAALPDGQRRSREELKQLVLAAGLELLLKDGLSLKPESLRYSAVLGYIRETYGVTVNRASVHRRLWSTHDDYCTEVLARSIQIDNDMPPLNLADEKTLAKLQPLSGGPDPFTADPIPWKQWSLDLVRQASDNWAEMASDSPRSRRRLLVKASLLERTDLDGLDPLADALTEVDTEARRRTRAVVANRLAQTGNVVNPALGLTMDEALDIHIALIHAMVNGVMFDRLAGIGTVSHRYRIRRIDGSGRFDDWTALPIALRAFYEFLFRHQSEL